MNFFFDPVLSLSQNLEKPTILNFVICKLVLILKIFMASMKRALTHRNKNDRGGPKG